MIQNLRITIVSDNNASAPGLVGEHGLSMLVEADGKRILFDTGQGKVLRKNVEAVGCRLDHLDAVVLSHGHYDHTGGLAEVLACDGEPQIFLHPAALEKKFERAKKPPHRPIGISPASLKSAQEAVSRIVWTESKTEVVPGVWCTGEIPQRSFPGAEEGRFYLDKECYDPDPLIDDQAVFIQTAKGIVLLAGCTHSGLMNTLDHVARLSGEDRIHAIVGGLHLTSAPPAAWYAAADAIRRSDVEWIAPCHCTGPNATTHLASSFGNRFREAGAGSRFTVS